jgi:hypothetical protein
MSPRCHIPSCLGHADERTAEVACARCAGQRWILVRPATAPDPTDYVRIRCKAVLAARNASDPVGSQAQQDARAQAGDRLRERRAQA